MANWAIPQLSDLKIDVLDQLKLRDVDSYTMAESPVNPPVGAKRWSATFNKFEAWNGTAWVPMIISIAGGGTGADNINGFLQNFGLGSMALQNSNAVTITGGSITGLSALGTLGNLTVAGVITAGSAPTTITNSAGQILESSIADGTIYARVAAAESISGVWTHVANLNTSNNAAVRINYGGTGAPGAYFTIGENPSAPAIACIHAYEAGVNAGNVIMGNNYLTTFANTTARVNTTTGGSFARYGINSIDLVGINATGVLYNFITMNPTGTTLSAAALAINAPTTINALLTLNGQRLVMNGIDASQSGIEWYTSGVKRAQYVLYNSDLYADAPNHFFRSLAFASQVSISNAGLLISSGDLFKTNSTFGLRLVAPNVQTFADIWYFTNNANTAHTMTLTVAGSLELPVAAGQICIAGGRGAGICISKNSGPGAAFYCHTPGSNAYTEFFTANGGAKLLSYNDTSVLVHGSGGLYLPDGTGDSPALHFISNAVAGLYYNPANPTLDFGCRFNFAGGRSIMRAWGNTPKIDFIIADTVMFTFQPGDARLAGHYYPNTANGYYLGHPTLPWLQAWARDGFTVTSDIRVKTVRGNVPDNVLDLIDSVDPLIAAFTENVAVPDMNGYVEPLHDFPTFSAQDIREKIDGPLGVKTVFGDEVLGLDYNRLTPLLWAAVRKLHARLKALENN